MQYWQFIPCLYMCDRISLDIHASGISLHFTMHRRDSLSLHLATGTQEKQILFQLKEAAKDTICLMHSEALMPGPHT